MAGIKDYPIKLNTTELPIASGWSESYSNVENVNISEAGTDIVEVTRLGKLTLGLSFRLMGSWAATFESFAFSDDPISVYLYDPSTNAYGAARTMRMRDYKKKLIEGAEKCDDTVKGMYDISFNLIEF